MKTVLAFIFLLLKPIFFFNDDNLPINKIQVIGSHNSYKEAIDPKLFDFFKKRDSTSAKKIDYSHIPIPQQLSLGLRNLEIDVYADEKGGKYANPKGLMWAPEQQAYDPKKELLKPGFKVLHIPDLDFRSSFLTFKNGLQELKKWSEQNPGHSPVFITLEAKDDSSKRTELTQPEKFTAQTFDDLDAEILNTLGKKHLLLPDDVRGNNKTLEGAVLAGKWPKISAAKGKFIFILDAVGAKRALYIKDHPSLKGRVLFANADAGMSEAAFMIKNNAKDPKIPSLVSKGYIIRTRADADTQQARTNDRSFFDAACKSGAQIITTDYYQKSSQFKSDYVVSFADGTYFRINPLFQKSN